MYIGQRSDIELFVMCFHFLFFMENRKLWQISRITHFGMVISTSNIMALIEIYDVYTRYENCVMDTLQFSITKIVMSCMCLTHSKFYTKSMSSWVQRQWTWPRQIFPFKYHVVCWPLHRRIMLIVYFFSIFALFCQNTVCFINLDKLNWTKGSEHRFIPCSPN